METRLFTEKTVFPFPVLPLLVVVLLLPRVSRTLIFEGQHVVSGIQPTGLLTVGNYVGSISQWLTLQEESMRGFYFSADLHACTSFFSRRGSESTNSIGFESRRLIAQLVACGVNEEQNTLFVQSDISEHSELYWLLACLTPLSRAWRMRSVRCRPMAMAMATSLGRLGYPLLMAADILLYGGDANVVKVAVGDDQIQHLEFARRLARNLNGRVVGDDVCCIPEAVVFPDSRKRLRSLVDATVKMSKSEGTDLSRINLLDSPREIERKIRKAKTDSLAGPIVWNDPNRPEATNFMTLLSSFLGVAGGEEAVEAYPDSIKSWGSLKGVLTDVLVEKLTPIRERCADLLNSRKLDDIIQAGRNKAKVEAHNRMQIIRKGLGFSR